MDDESITPIPIPDCSAMLEPSAPKSTAIPHVCFGGCQYLTPKEHDLLEHLYVCHMELQILQSTLWREFCRLKNLSDQVNNWREAYLKTSRTLVINAIKRGGGK